MCENYNNGDYIDGDDIDGDNIDSLQNIANRLSQSRHLRKQKHKKSDLPTRFSSKRAPRKLCELGIIMLFRLLHTSSSST
jgi:hypothetical protein